MTTPDITNMEAFHAGYKAFYNGSRKPYRFSSAHMLDIRRRLKLLRVKGDKEANAIALKFKGMGIYLVDVYEKGDVFPVETTGEITTQAVNPFIAGTYASKEWERGFNAAYFKQKESLKNATVSDRIRTWHGYQRQPMDAAHRKERKTFVRGGMSGRQSPVQRRA